MTGCWCFSTAGRMLPALSPPKAIHSTCTRGKVWFGMFFAPGTCALSWAIWGSATCDTPLPVPPNRRPSAQPFYVNSPFGIVLGHNGNLTNAAQLNQELFREDLRHVNTSSDSEVLLNVLAHELQRSTKNQQLDPAAIFAAVARVHQRCRGAYAVIAMIAGYGLLAFRDPYGSVHWYLVPPRTSMGWRIWWHPRVWRWIRWDLS